MGLDMDLIKAIGEDQGFDVEFENLSFDGLIPALKAGNIDIVAAGMNKDDEDRQKEVDFSDSYYESKLFVAVTEDNTTITVSYTHLCGRSFRRNWEQSIILYI